MNAHTVEKISQKIKEKISEVGISVHALEKKAGLKQSAIQNILYGKSKKPSLHIIQSIAQALNCSVLDLLNEEETSTLLESQRSFSKRELDSDFAVPWNLDLFAETLSIICALSKKKNIFLSKEKVLYCTEEVYAYSIKNKKNKPDKHFAEWLIEKNFRAYD